MSKKKREEAVKKYIGAVITPKNRRTFFQQYKKDFLKKIDNEGNPDQYNVHELDILSDQYANLEVNRNKKQLKAYLKGDRFFKFYGKTYPVMTVSPKDKSEEE